MAAMSIKNNAWHLLALLVLRQMQCAVAHPGMNITRMMVVTLDILEQAETADCDVGLSFDGDMAAEITAMARILQSEQHRRVVTIADTNDLVTGTNQHCVVDVVLGSDKFIRERMIMAKSAREPTSASAFYLVMPVSGKDHDPRTYGAHEIRQQSPINQPGYLNHISHKWQEFCNACY